MRLSTRFASLLLFAVLPLAAFAAASISKASPMRTGWKATNIAMAGFVLPYMAGYRPALMLQPTPAGSGLDVLGAAYLVFCQPTLKLLLAGAVVGFAGLVLRAWSAGQVVDHRLGEGIGAELAAEVARLLAGPEGAVVSEFSTRSRDESDVFTDPRIVR